MSKIYIKPAPGLKVRTQQGSFLPEEGAEVERDSFWVRRINDGDVVETTPPKAKKPAQAE